VGGGRAGIEKCVWRREPSLSRYRYKESGVVVNIVNQEVGRVGSGRVACRNKP
jgi:hypothetical protein